jgi:hypothetical protein
MVATLLLLILFLVDNIKNLHRLAVAPVATLLLSNRFVVDNRGKFHRQERLYHPIKQDG